MSTSSKIFLLWSDGRFTVNCYTYIYLFLRSNMYKIYNFEYLFHIYFVFGYLFYIYFEYISIYFINTIFIHYFRLQNEVPLLLSTSLKNPKSNFEQLKLQVHLLYIIHLLILAVTIPHAFVMHSFSDEDWLFLYETLFPINV